MNNLLLEIEHLTVEVGGHTILSDFHLAIQEGTTHVIFGPNGSGKSTLLGTMMGLPQYKVLNGDIRFQGQSILDMPVHERANLGLGLAFQHPPTIKGVTLKKMLETIQKSEDNLLFSAERLRMKEYLHRDINRGFSGGEAKRSEILQLKMMAPQLMMLDEPESGVDFENIAILADVIKDMLGKDLPQEKRSRSGLIITHTGFIIQHIGADVGHVIINGRIVCSGNPHTIFEKIQKCGFDECPICMNE